ncbi:hypothetical protein [uncultured Streptomyces sp.]|uniref:Rv1733c family protein n=1 Tax=uncultured Streptomyces sp. TaxID=174707 RepID=UPI002615330C|nr:hypothetical protein [uncultured Streptomyces sp.]
MRTVLGVWRWRHNPLRRATDRHEAWLALVALLLMVCVAPVAAWRAGAATDAVLLDAVRAQRLHRHLVPGVVVSRARPAGFAGDPEAGATAVTSTVVARWKTPDGSTRTGTVPTGSAPRTPGSRIAVWTDDRGAPAVRPMDAPTAHTHAVLAGLGALLLTAGGVEAGRRLLLRGMVRRRHERLDRAWASVGPDWGRAGTGC